MSRVNSSLPLLRQALTGANHAPIVARSIHTSCSSSFASSSSSSSTPSAESSSQSSSTSVAPQLGSKQQKPKKLSPVLPRTFIPPARIVVGPTQINRLQEHYKRTLSSDLLYMIYDHPDPTKPREEVVTSTSEAEEVDRNRRWDLSDPYAKQRPARAPRGNRRLQPLTRPISLDQTARDMPKLERIVLSCFSKDSITNKHNLIPLVAMVRAITGLSPLGTNADLGLMGITSGSKLANRGSGYVEIIKAKSGVASFKLRPGMPIGVKATLFGPEAYDFLEVLTTFVLPRLRSFNGFPLPPSSEIASSPSAVSGVVSLGMGPEAMGLFPQVEVNLDQYPGRGVGFQIDCITNRRGRKATENARTLLSGLGVPFVRRGDV
ncbi:ribosomal protein L5 [Violaceomyces palustris]|uniref:Ribosomal protein L5 n=1 Tax=Violaceomyces palustris TaxID=1673888 RepID=A0ACD0NLS4_9BASI|nr:ribosomal protein L5 [Violaceomyces palustris]